MKTRERHNPRTHIFAVIALLSLSACAVSPDSPDKPDPKVAATEQEPVTLDRQFAEIAKKVPSFAGFYYTDAGEPTIALSSNLSGKEDAQEAAEILSDVFGKNAFNKQFSPKEIESALDNRGQELKTVGLEPKIVSVKYSFAELSKIYEQINAVIWKQSSVTSLDLDEMHNRVVVGTEKDGVKSALAALAKLQLPGDAYRVEADPAPREMQTLRTRYRPLMSGLQINFDSSACTLGFNAVRRGVAGFVTNSHCTSDQTRVTGTSYRQTTGETVGVEIAEARLFPCSGGSQCRWADAAFARHLTDNFSLGAVAPVGFSSLNILTSIGQDDIVSTSNPIGGETLTKIGRTTGRTTGRVSATCYNTRAAGSSILNRCQYDVTSTLPVGTTPVSSRGDSGSSVLKFVGTSGSKHLFELKGLLWGSRTLSGINDFVFSPVSGVTAALGVLETDAPAATFAVQVDIRRIAAIGSFGEAPDFYAKVTVNGRTTKGRVVDDNRLVSPYQMFTFSGEAADRIPVHIELWDEDGGLRFRDDRVDINPGRSKVLDFTLNTRTGTITGDISSRTGRTINVAGTPDEAAAMSFVVDVIR